MVVHRSPCFHSRASTPSHDMPGNIVFAYALGGSGNVAQRRWGEEIVGEVDTLDSADLCDKIVELLLGVVVLLLHLLVLGFPLVALRLEGLDFAFVMTGFDVSLAEPDDRWLLRVSGRGEGGRGVLVIGFPQLPVGLFGLLLEHLQLSLKGFILRTMLHTLVGGGLVLLDSRLELLDIGLEHAVTVLKGRDLLLLGQIVLLEGLDFGLELLDLGSALISLKAEGVHALLALSASSPVHGLRAARATMVGWRRRGVTIEADRVRSTYLLDAVHVGRWALDLGIGWIFCKASRAAQSKREQDNGGGMFAEKMAGLRTSEFRGRTSGGSFSRPAHAALLLLGTIPAPSCLPQPCVRYFIIALTRSSCLLPPDLYSAFIMAGTLSRRDQENLIHAHQTAAAAKPLNQSVRALAPRTPGNHAVRRRQNDENATVGQTKGDKAKSAAITPAPTTARAPLGQKTTNAKARAFATPAPLTGGLGKTHHRSASARKQKLKVHHQVEPEAAPVSHEVDEEEPDVEYCPPKAEGTPACSTCAQSSANHVSLQTCRTCQTT